MIIEVAKIGNGHDPIGKPEDEWSNEEGSFRPDVEPGVNWQKISETDTTFIVQILSS